MLGIGDQVPEFSITGVKPGFNKHIEDGESAFETKWTRGSDMVIHCYCDRLSPDGIALVPGGQLVNEIADADALKFGGRVRTVNRGRMVVLRNANGFYAAVRVVGIKDSSRGAGDDELAIEIWILPEKGRDFSGVLD